MTKYLCMLCSLALTSLMGVSRADDARPGTPRPPGPNPSPAPEGAAPPRPPFAGFPAGASTTPKPRPYKEVSTDKAVTQQGIFTVHQIDEKVLFETFQMRRP